MGAPRAACASMASASATSASRQPIARVWPHAALMAVARNSHHAQAMGGASAGRACASQAGRGTSAPLAVGAPPAARATAFALQVSVCVPMASRASIVAPRSLAPMTARARGGVTGASAPAAPAALVPIARAPALIGRASAQTSAPLTRAVDIAIGTPGGANVPQAGRGRRVTGCGSAVPRAKRTARVCCPTAHASATQASRVQTAPSGIAARRAARTTARALRTSPAYASPATRGTLATRGSLVHPTAPAMVAVTAPGASATMAISAAIAQYTRPHNAPHGFQKP